MRNEFLLAFSMKEKGDWARILENIKKKVPVSKEEIHEAYGKVSGDILLFSDQDYPEKFKNISYPPFCLYTKGNKNLLKKKNVLGVVGSRNLSPYGKKAIRQLLNEVYDNEPDTTIVSGLAMGADAEAMRVAMERKGTIIGVSGAGIDTIYPQSSKDVYEYCQAENGLLISEYPEAMQPKPENFPMRNRIIVGLCDALLVIEGDEKSGTSISVGYAVEQGKTVMAIPRGIDTGKPLTNKLIRDGAEIVLSGSDIIDFLNMRR